jgi:hypothetical protein
VGLEWGPFSFVTTIESYLEEKVADPVQKTENTAAAIRCADHASPLSIKVGTNVSYKRRSLGIVRSQTKATEFVLILYLQ